MNTTQKLNTQDLEIIEQIVSGELTDQERSQHLNRFQTASSPLAYWRALALAFIEKQIFKQAFADIETLPHISETPEHLAPSPRSAKKRPWLIPLACAAVILLTFGFMAISNLGPIVTSGNLSATAAQDISPSSETPTSPVSEATQTRTPITAYVATYLENGDQLVVPINYYASRN